MLNKFIYSLLVSLLCFYFCGAQEEGSLDDSVSTELIVVKDTLNSKKEPINVLAPAKAAFYSAVLPGLGQAYNKKYWKIPLVYAAIGIPVYFYIQNDNEYNVFRDAYKGRLAGIEMGSERDPFPNVTNEGLINAQKQLRRRKELALLIALGAYALNIVDANVDAHLLQFNVDEDLTLRPHFKYNQMENNTDLGLTLNFKF
ncbi:MAG: DUF5683 domain-containing protein [Psychroserpens sp.]|uniref:DUF5683 domain-containing protein n=1 Tax=Psychroserpens sp. TaxID=2020870 RepID=UPI003C7069B6